MARLDAGLLGPRCCFSDDLRTSDKGDDGLDEMDDG